MNKSLFNAIWGLFLLCTQPLFSQNIKLNLNQRGEDADYAKLMMVTQIFTFKNDSVANPLDLASAKKTDPISWKKIISPVMNQKFRKGFAWVFGTGYNDKFAPNHTLILIENPGWTNWNTIIWTDRNHNYDLTDDGNPDTLTGTGKIHLNLDFLPNGFRVELEHFPAKSFSQFAEMNDKALYALQGKRQFMGTENCFRERRLNVVYGSWSNGRDSFSIAVKDANCNGRYNDDDLDVVMITDKGSVFNNLQATTFKKSKTYLEWNNVAFTVLNVESDASQITIYRDTAARMKLSLNIGDKLPRFRYATVSTTTPKKLGSHREVFKLKKVSIRRLKGKETFLYIWYDQSEKYLRDSALLHALGRLKEPSFQALSLNYGASGKYIFRYNRRFNTELLQGFSSNKTNRRLMVRRIPESILVNSKQRIVAIGKTPLEMLEILTH